MVDFACKGLHSRRFSNPRVAHPQTDRSINELIRPIHIGYLHAEANWSEGLVPRACRAVKRLVATREISRKFSKLTSGCGYLPLVELCESPAKAVKLDVRFAVAGGATTPEPVCRIAAMDISAVSWRVCL